MKNNSIEQLVTYFSVILAIFFALHGFSIIHIVPESWLNGIGFSAESQNTNLITIAIVYLYLLFIGLILYLVLIVLFIFTKNNDLQTLMDILDELRERIIDLKKIEYSVFKLLVGIIITVIIFFVSNILTLTTNLSFIFLAVFLFIQTFFPKEPPKNFKFFR